MDRYQAGDRSQVWADMVALGPMIRSDAEMLAEAEEVGRETMRRARRNVERLVEQLPLVGYVFEPGAELVI